MEIEKDNVATIEDPSMKPPPPSQGVIIEQIADGDDVAPRPFNSVEFEDESEPKVE